MYNSICSEYSTLTLMFCRSISVVSLRESIAEGWLSALKSDRRMLLLEIAEWKMLELIIVLS